MCGEAMKRSDVGVVRRLTVCGLWKIRKVGRGEGRRRRKANGCSNIYIFFVFF